jgi:hypothetical protein
MQEDDDIINSWNLRKCSAAGLDILSTVFGDEILPVLMPLVQVFLLSCGTCNFGCFSFFESRDLELVSLQNACLRSCGSPTLQSGGVQCRAVFISQSVSVTVVVVLQVRLSTTADAAWKEREAAVLALGAVAEGCISGLLPHLSRV